jgi:hypothetical protein
VYIVSTSAVEFSDTVFNGYRASATANRSLPDIPIDSQRTQLESGDTLWENSEHNGDTSSELYATVEENKHVPLLGECQSTVVGAISSFVHLNSVYLVKVKFSLFLSKHRPLGCMGKSD